MCFWTIIGWILGIESKYSEKNWCTLWVRNKHGTRDWVKVKDREYYKYDAKHDRFKLKYENHTDSDVRVKCKLRYYDISSDSWKTPKQLVINTYVPPWGTYRWTSFEHHLKPASRESQHLIFTASGDWGTKTRIFYVSGTKVKRKKKRCKKSHK